MPRDPDLRLIAQALHGRRRTSREQGKVSSSVPGQPRLSGLSGAESLQVTSRSAGRMSFWQDQRILWAAWLAFARITLGYPLASASCSLPRHIVGVEEVTVHVPYLDLGEAGFAQHLAKFLLTHHRPQPGATLRQRYGYTVKH